MGPARKFVFLAPLSLSTSVFIKGVYRAT